jgi:hypothetical protein
LAPRSRAARHSRSRAWFLLSASSFVYWGISPPKVDWKPAAKLPKAPRDRTVRPNASPCAAT